MTVFDVVTGFSSIGIGRSTKQWADVEVFVHEWDLRLAGKSLADREVIRLRDYP